MNYIFFKQLFLGSCLLIKVKIDITDDILETKKKILDVLKNKY